MFKITAFEGRLALWNGLRPTLVLQVPNTIVYLGAYEELRKQLGVRLPESVSWTAPALAGMIARTVAATSVAPLELVRTRRQAAKHWPHSTVMKALRSIVRNEGCEVLFRGLGVRHVHTHLEHTPINFKPPFPDTHRSNFISRCAF